MIVLLTCEQGSIYWSEKRKDSKNPRISASELACVLCMHRYKSRAKYFSEKKNGKVETPDNPILLHGRFWEQFALSKVASFFPGWRLLKPGGFLDWESPFSCSPDMMMSLERPEEEIDLLVGVETKCPWSSPIPKKKEDIPDEYLLQSFSCLMATGSDRWILAFYDTPTDSLVSYEIYPDSDLWDQTLLPLVRRFLGWLARDNAEPTTPGSRQTKSEAEKKKKELAKFLRKGKKEAEEAAFIRKRLLKMTFPLSLSLGSRPEDYSYQ